jgi:hypothetical protein
MNNDKLLCNNFLNLEKYFDNYKDSLSSEFYKRFNDFEFDNKELFELAVLSNVFVHKIDFYKKEKERKYQTEFSKKIFNRDNKCIVTNKGNSIEFEACHIVPVSEGGDYTESNGLLLTRNLHKLYDDYLWSINPETLCIETICDDEEIIGSIVDYLGIKVTLKPDYLMLINLKSHWDKFSKKKTLFM